MPSPKITDVNPFMCKTRGKLGDRLTIDLKKRGYWLRFYGQVCKGGGAGVSPTTVTASAINARATSQGLSFSSTKLASSIASVITTEVPSQYIICSCSVTSPCFSSTVFRTADRLMTTPIDADFRKS